MDEVFLLLGSNLGQRERMLHDAFKMINLKVGRITKHSSVYESEPWGFTSNNKFLNIVIAVKTDEKPLTLLNILQNIEQELGKENNGKNEGYSNRTIDIDILFFHEEIINTRHLTLPHPLLHQRRFTLLPLYEISPDLVHPVFNKTISQLLKECSDDSEVKKSSSLPMN